METINQDNLQAISNEAIFFKHNNFNLWNINEFKKPINISTNFGLTDWSKYNLDDFNKLRVDLTKNIGFLSGYQYKTKQFIIVLDFDIFSKKKKNDIIANLYDNFSIIDYPKNISKKGHYNSSTCGNKGVILDITEYPEFISYLQSFKVAKIGGGLEILISNNVILPPSITVCKNCNTSQHNRKFIDEIGIAKLTQETECFIRLYIDDFKKKKPNTTQIRDTKNAKHGVIHYSNIINEDDDDNKPSYECILKLVKQCLKIVINDEYQGWFFITSSLINSYGNSIDNYNLYDIICKTVNNYDKEDNLLFWNTTNVSKYECYNYKAIINASYFYDQLTTYCILGEEYKRIEKEKEAAKTQKQYSKWKLEFEKTHAKIISPLNFLDIINGEVEFISQTELKQRYAEKGEFINIWLKDDTKRIYQKIIFKPDANDEDNKENYNLFNGFRASKMLGNQNISSDNKTSIIKIFLEFLNLFSGNKDYKNIDKQKNISLRLVIAYIIKIIKYKQRPKIAFVCRSVRRQGCGKGTFYNLLCALIGELYCCETSNIDDLFGNFNDSRVNKILIAVDETSGADSFKFTGKLKNAITENKFTANPKYGKRFELDNYNSYLFFSNNERCVCVEIGNRRFWVIDIPKCSEPNFLIMVNKDIVNNDDSIKIIYDYLINDAEKEFNIDFDTFNFEEYIRHNENNSTKNLKQIYAKDLFFVNFYENKIKINIDKLNKLNKHDKNENTKTNNVEVDINSTDKPDTNENTDTNETSKNNGDNIKFNKEKTKCLIKSKELYDEYRQFFIISNVGKDGGNSGSNQGFYKSLEFYDFIKSSKINGSEYYIIDIKQIDEWYKLKEGDSNFEEISNDDLEAMGFDLDMDL